MAKMKAEGFMSKIKHRITLYESFSGRTFETTIEELQNAEYYLNRNYILTGHVSLNDFYNLLGIPETKIGKQFGWSYELGMHAGYEWIDFAHRKETLPDGTVKYTLDYIYKPMGDYDK